VIAYPVIDFVNAQVIAHPVIDFVNAQVIAHPVIDFVNAQVIALSLFNKTKYEKTQEKNYYFNMKSVNSSFCWS